MRDCSRVLAQVFASTDRARAKTGMLLSRELCEARAHLPLLWSVLKEKERIKKENEGNDASESRRSASLIRDHGDIRIKIKKANIQHFLSRYLCTTHLSPL